MLSWELPKEEGQEVAEQVQPQKGYFSQVFDNIGTWGKAAYADTRQIGLDTKIKDTFDAINNHQYRNYEEYMALRNQLWNLVDEQEQYQNDFAKNQKILDENKSELADLTQIGGTAHGIGTQFKDTLIGGVTGALAYGLPAAAASGGVAALPAAMVGAVKGATWANRYGALDQAYQDARLNAIDAWKTVLREGGNAEQAEQAYKDALVNNLPTEALDAASSMYMGSKILGKAIGSDFAKRVSKSAIGNAAQKVSKFDLPSRIATAVADKTGKSWVGKGVGFGLATLENAGEEGVQEPWQDYATARAVDIQRRQYDPTHEGIRDFSVFGDGGLLDYYTTPEGKETAWKAAKMGAVFGSVGGVLTASEHTKLGTAHSDSIRAGEQIAKEFSEGGDLANKLNADKKEEMRGVVGNLYDLSESDTANLSDKEVYRMWHDYWTNKLSTGGLFSSGNRQEVSAAVQADMINALTDEETNRMGLMNDSAKKYIDKYGMNPDGSILQHVNEQVQQQTQQQVEQAAQQTEQQGTQEGVGIYAKGTDKTFGNTQTNEEQTSSEQPKRGYWDLPEQFDNAKQWERIDEGNDQLDYNEEAYYKNNITGRVAHILRIRGGKGYEYVVTDVTDKDNKGQARGQFKKIKFDSIQNVGKYLNTPHANKADTAFMADSQNSNELAGIKQQLPKEDGVISQKDSQNDGKIWKDVNGNQWLNGKLIQSNKAEEVHTLLDLNKYYREHSDLMDADLYAEVARDMMRFGIGKSNNTSIVLDLNNEWSGARGSKTTERDANGAISKAVVRLYAGADLVTAAHEVAHLGWINLSDQDKETFGNWAIDTEEKFVAQVLGRQYDDNFKAYLLEALTNQGVGGSRDSQVLWAKIQMQGATRQTIDILNNHRNAQNMADAIDERFAWEFSNWFAQGYIRGSEPRNVIERILQKACMSMGKALNLLADTKRYLDGDQSREVNRIFTNMSATKKDYGQVRTAPQMQTTEPVSIRTEMTQPVQNAPYNMGQGFIEQTETENYLDSPSQTQNLGRNTGTIGAATYQQPQPTQASPEQDLSKNAGTMPVNLANEPDEVVNNKPVNYQDVQNPQETIDQYRERTQKEQEEDDKIQKTKVAGYKEYKDSTIKSLVRGALENKKGFRENLMKIRQNVNPARLESIIDEVVAERKKKQEKNMKKISKTKFTNQNMEAHPLGVGQTSLRKNELKANPLPLGSQGSYSMPRLATPMNQEALDKMNEAYKAGTTAPQQQSLFGEEETIENTEQVQNNQPETKEDKPKTKKKSTSKKVKKEAKKQNVEERTFEEITEQTAKENGDNYVAREDALKNPDLSFKRAYFELITTLEEGEGDWEELPLNQDGELAPSNSLKAANKALTVLNYGVKGNNPESCFFMAELGTGNWSPNVDLNYESFEDIISERFDYDTEDYIDMYKKAAEAGIKDAYERLSSVYFQEGERELSDIWENVENGKKTVEEALKYEEENYETDTKSQASSKEEIAKNRKPTLWSISATGGKTAIRRSKFGVGKDVSGQIYFHKDYAEDVIDADTLKKAKEIAHREGFTEDKYNCMMYDTHTGVVRFDEAPDFDTAREPITGKYLRVYPDGHTERSNGKENQEGQIWHHKWLWVKEDYKGFDVQASRDWSEKWLDANKGKGRPSGYIKQWNKRLDELGLPHDTKMQVESVNEDLGQESGNAESSLNQVPALMRKIEWKKGTVNADIGGGEFNTATEFMKEKGVENIVFDPWNRDIEHNRKSVNKIQNKVDTVTVCNVLNVIPDEKNMDNVIMQAAECLKPDGKAYFSTYEGDGSGVMKKVRNTNNIQQHKKTKWYVPLIEKHFKNVKVKDKIITASDPIPSNTKAKWSLSKGTNVVTIDYNNTTDTKSQGESKELTQTRSLQEAADALGRDMIELNAITVYDEESKNYMRGQMLDRGFTEAEADDLINELVKTADEVVEIAKRHPRFKEWQEKDVVSKRVPNDKLGLLPIRNAFRSNGEYKVNMDLGTLCMKREAFDALMQIAIKEEFGSRLGATQIEGLKEVLKKYKYATACDVCYVETRRSRLLQYAQNVSYDWQSVLEALNLNDGKALGTERTLDGVIKKNGKTYTQRQVLDMMISTKKDENGVKEYVKAFDMFVPEERKRGRIKNKSGKFTDVDTGTTADKMYKIAKLFDEDSHLAGYFNPDLLLTSEGTGKLAMEYGGHTNIIETLGGLDAQNTPKPIESFIVYDPLSWKDANGLSENQLINYLGADKDGNVDIGRENESIYDIGGGRMQAFSDFNPILFLDYCQLIADYAARRMPIHAYTKVPALVELFGQTRMMINMSLLPEVVDGVDENHIGLDKDGNYAWNKDSFPPELAFEYRKREEYEGHVGIIAIGASDEHIRKMMRDPEIDMIIPYHKSGMAKGVQIKTGLEHAKDYTSEQTLKYPKDKEKETKEKILQDTGIKADVYLNYSRVLFTEKDPRKAAKEYLRRCKKYGCTPIFERFSKEDGYYKVLEDFRGYKNDNKTPVLQEAARFKLPDNWNEILKKQLSAREKMIEYKEKMSQNEDLLRDMRKVFTPQRIDGEIKDRLLKALRKVFGSESMEKEAKKLFKANNPRSWKDKLSNVKCLRQNDFLDALEEEYKKNVSPEQAAKAIEVYRKRDGIVYGFARGNQIVLNEDYFNANTPAHEFAHLWAKVASKINPTLWNEGVNLLYKQERKLWDSVYNDPLYKSIRNNRNAIASEVLARLVGKQNEDFIAGILNPKEKLNKGIKLTQQIKNWCMRMLSAVRSVFDTNNNKPLTLDEFVKMPLKAIWDADENALLAKKANKTLKSMKSEEDIRSSEQDFSSISTFSKIDVNKANKSDTKMQEESETANAILQQAFPDTKFQFAWHGTEHDFDEFSLKHLLSGEGAMAHGWGLYFALDPYIGLRYARELGEAAVEYSGKVNEKDQKIIDDLSYQIDLRKEQDHVSIEKAIESSLKEYQWEVKYYEREVSRENSQSDKKHLAKFKKYVDLLQNHKDEFVYKSEGKLLKVDIPENNVLLKEGFTFEDQPKFVQRQLLKLFKDKKFSNSQIRYLTNSTNIYNQLFDYVNKKAVVSDSDYKEVSVLLNKYGIKGISYTGLGDGECVVIFDDKAIDIVSKFKVEEGKWKLEKVDNARNREADKQKAQRKLEKRRAQQGDTKMQLHSEEGLEKTDINTPAFKNWFKGSIMTNDDGTPKVLYRGLDQHYSPEFDKEEGGIVWVSDDLEHAKSYRDSYLDTEPTFSAADKKKYEETGIKEFTGKPSMQRVFAEEDSRVEEGDLLEAYVNIKNPFDMGIVNDKKSPHNLYVDIGNELKKDVQKGTITEQQMRQVLEELSYLNKKDKKGNYPTRAVEVTTHFAKKKFWNAFKNVGYDSVKGTENGINNTEGKNVYGVFDKGNVKSIYNQGTWDKSNPDTKMQGNSDETYLDKEKDIYSVTFTKSAQKVAENQKKMKHYRDNASYWRENPNKDGSITFVRALPYKHHTRTIIYDDIDGKKIGKRPKAKALEYLEAFKDQIVKWFFNDKHFLYKAAKQIGALDSYMRMMVMKDQGAVAGAAIEDGIVKHNGKNGERTKSLNSIIEAVGEENQIEFLKYCEAFRVLDLYDRKILQKMTSEDDTLAKQIIADVKNGKNAKLFEEQRKNFVEYNHELLWVLVDGGFITEDTYNKLIKNDPNFVPLAKNMDELEGYVDSFGNSKSMININNPLHKIKTSFREVKNPFLEMQKRTVEYYVKASRNKAGMIFVNDIAKAIAKSANGDIVAMNQGMVRKLKSRDRNGVPIRADSLQNVFYIWNNGEKEYYQVADREIYAALKSFDSEQMSALKKIVDQTAGRASRLVRNTATMTPDFGLRNLCRDTVEAFISSQHGFIPIIDSLWGMYQMANDTQWYREYQRMNGEPLNTLNRGGGEDDVATVEHGVKDNIKMWKTYRPLIKKDYREFMDKDRSKTARAKSLLLLTTDVIGLHSLYKANKRLNDYLETGTRIGEYRNARMGYHGLSGRLFGSKVKGSRIFTTDRDLIHATHDEMFAAYKSKDVTLNFGQHGSLGKELNHYIPFFNASLQGIYKICNTIGEMVYGEDTRIKQELWFKCILFGAMGMAAALAGADDDDYTEAPEWEHDNFWILPSGIRIAKDQLFGRMIAGTVEKATRQYLRDGDVKKLDLLYDVLGNFVIDKCTPAIADMWLGTWGNYDTFRKQAVVPEYMERKGMYGYLKKDLSTSKIAADISEALLDTIGVDIAAKKVDFFLQKTLSNTGNYVRNLYELGTNPNERMTRGAEPEDKGGFAEWSKELPYPMNTIVGTFATNRNSFQSISDFYTRYKELQTKSSAPERMSKAEGRAWKAYEAAYKQDKSYRNALKAIKQDKSLTGAQKRERADKIFKQQIRMARKLRDYERRQGLI